MLMVLYTIVTWWQVPRKLTKMLGFLKSGNPLLPNVMDCSPFAAIGWSSALGPLHYNPLDRIT